MSPGCRPTSISVNRFSSANAASSASRNWRGVCALESAAAPQFGELRERPPDGLVVARVGKERLQHLPAAVVEQHDDRVAAVPARVRDLAARHLERAVADQHQRPPAARNLHAQRRRHRKSHRGVVGRRDAFVRADVDAREQRIAGVGDQRQLRMLLDELVHQPDDVLHLDLLVLLERIEDLRPTRRCPSPRRCGPSTGRSDISSAIDQHVDRRVLELVVLDEHLARHADDEVVLVDAIGRDAQARVADELAEQQQAIRRLDDFAKRLRADPAQIGADELRMARRKHAASEK